MTNIIRGLFTLIIAFMTNKQIQVPPPMEFNSVSNVKIGIQDGLLGMLAREQPYRGTRC